RASGHDDGELFTAITRNAVTTATGSPLSGVLALAERLREAVEALPLPEGPVSISVGVGYLHPPALASADQLLADADA
ncbi:hypothetical protein, partial [Enterobacter hormaechei]|uniref:hypothetical protein n=1 Tax=Enterobacter hormaechei TaxID=158836 RepID=UPI0020401676